MEEVDDAWFRLHRNIPPMGPNTGSPGRQMYRDLLARHGPRGDRAMLSASARALALGAAALAPAVYSAFKRPKFENAETLRRFSTLDTGEPFLPHHPKSIEREVIPAQAAPRVSLRGSVPRQAFQPGYYVTRRRSVTPGRTVRGQYGPATLYHTAQMPAVTRYWQRRTRFVAQRKMRRFRKGRTRRVRRFRRRFGRVRKFFRRYARRMRGKRSRGFRGRRRGASIAQAYRWVRQPNINRVVQVSYCTNRIVLGMPGPIGTNVDTIPSPYRLRDSPLWKTFSRYGELDYCIPLEPFFLGWIAQTVPFNNPVYGVQPVVPDGIVNPGGLNLAKMLASLRLMMVRDLRPDPGVTSKASMWQYVPSCRPMITTTKTTLPEYKVAWMKVYFKPVRASPRTMLTTADVGDGVSVPVNDYASGFQRGLPPGFDYRQNMKMRWQYRLWKNSAVAAPVFPNETIAGSSVVQPNTGDIIPYNASSAEDGWRTVKGFFRKFLRPSIPRGTRLTPGDGSLEELGDPFAPTTTAAVKYDHRYSGWRKYGDTNFKVPSATGGSPGFPWNFPGDPQVNADKKWTLPGAWLQLRFQNCQQWYETHYPNAAYIPVFPVFGELVIQSKILWRGVAETAAFQVGPTTYPELPGVPDVTADAFTTGEHGAGVDSRERDLDNTIFDQTAP